MIIRISLNSTEIRTEDRISYFFALFNDTFYSFHIDLVIIGASSVRRNTK